MRKKKMLSIVLALALMVSSFVIGYAEVSVYTEEQILESLTESESVDFTLMEEEEMQAFAAKGTNAIIHKDKGLKLTVGDAKKNDGVTNLGYAEFDLGFSHCLRENEAVKFTFMPTTKQSNVLVIADFMGNGERLKIRTEVIGGKQVLVYHTGENGSSSARGISSFEVSANKIYDVIAKKSAGKIDLYAKEESQQSYKLILSQQMIYQTTASAFKLHITGAPGSSAIFHGVTQYVGNSKTGVLGYSGAVLHHFDFDENYDGVAGADGTSTLGFDFGKSNRWNFNGNYIPKGGAMAVRFRINRSPFESWVAGEEGRAILRVDANGVVLLKTKTNPRNEIQIATIEQNTWYTFLVKDNGKGWTVWMAEGEENDFVKLISTAEKEESTAPTYTNVTLSGQSGSYADYFTIFGPCGTDVPKEQGMSLLHQLDFSEEENILDSSKVLSKKNAEVVNGLLSLTETKDGTNNVRGEFFYDGEGIPAGGYAEYSIKGPNVIHKFFQGEHYMAVNSIAYGMDGLTPTLKYPNKSNSWSATSNITHTPNVAWVYRIGRSSDGKTYSVWRKTADSDVWTTVFQNISVRSMDVAQNYGFDGTGEIDYVRIYAPNEKGILLTDGKNTTNIIDNITEPRYPWETRILVDVPEDGVIFAGLYDVKGAIKDFAIQEVFAEQETSVIVDISNIEALKVFVWDSFENMRPLCNDYSLKCNGNNYFIDFNDEDDISDWKIEDGFKMHDGVMEFVGNSDVAGNMRKTIKPVDEYVFEMRVQCPEYGYNGLYLSLITGNYYVTAHVNPERNTDVRTSTAFAQGGELIWGKDEWKVVKVETYDEGKRAILSFDDVPYMDFELPVSGYGYEEIIIGGYQRTGGTRATKFNIDWISFEPKVPKDKITILTPEDGNEYAENSDVVLSAQVDAALDIPQVEYKLHGNTVAIGYAPDYKAVLPNVSVGTYDVVAEYQNQKSDEVSIVVTEKTKVDLEFDGTILKPTIEDTVGKIAKAEYYLDGNLISTVTSAPFEAELSKLDGATHSICGKFYDKNGILICSDTITYTPQITEETPSKSYANDVTYQVSGESGTAEIQVNNGRHSMVIKHSPDKVSYLTADGMKEYAISAIGSWEILTDAYVADVYRNGQLVFSYLMPKTEEVGSSVTRNGLEITDFTVAIPEHKTNYFLQTDYVGESIKTYEISNLPYDYNLDFVAKKNDNIRFAVSDGDFHLDFAFEDGKIWAQDVDNEGMHPRRRYQTNVPNIDGDIYYRAEVAGGFMRLYADGKWLTTVRMPRSSDPDGFAIKTNDTLKYVSLCANEDLYLYSDNFDGSGESPSLDYWELKETTAAVDETNGILSLTATEGNAGRAEINAIPGYAVVEANLDMSKSEGGVYILFDVASNATEAKAGYNKETRQFEIVRKTRFGETKKTVNAGYEFILEFLFSQSVKLRVELVQHLGQETIYLYANDKLMLTDVEGIKERGMVGLIFGGGTLKVDSFSYRGDGHPVVSAKEWNTDLSTQYNLIEKEDEWVLLDWNSKLRSTDFGKTWANETYANTMESCHTVRLQSGALLVANRVWGNDEKGFRTTTYRCGISYDDGETWRNLGTIATPAYGEATCNRLKQGPSGRVYFVMSRRGAHDDGWCRVYWSDDDGATWTEGMELGISNIGHQCCEAEAIEMPNGEVRLYFRNETGMLIYITSPDRGKTWDFTPRKTSILMPSTNFNIEQDPYEPNTFYAVYTYSNSNEHGRDQGPRCRLAVSVSYDGGNQWQFLGTLFEEEIEMFYATRGSDVSTMMNININATKDHLVVTLPYNSEVPTTERNWFLRVITLDKAKLKTLAKPEKLHTRVATIKQSTPVAEYAMERTLIVDKNSANALIGGTVYKGIAKEDALPVAYIAKFLGVSSEIITDKEVTFRQGDFEVTLDESAVFSVDGVLYVSLEAMAETFHLFLNRTDDLVIVSGRPQWSVEQIRTFQYALNLFADSERVYVNKNLNPENTWESYLDYLDEYFKDKEK